MSTFAPGPWFSKFEQYRYVISCQGEFGPYKAVAITAGYYADSEPTARLIAAAPDLLEALQYAVKQVPELSTVPGISAAIAKALGESS